jgi:lipoate-protein ligase A
MANFIPFSKFDADTNMQIDKLILEQSVKDNLAPTLRLYGWKSPSVTLGKNQSLEGVNKDFCAKNNIGTVHRPTGGRAVFHDVELTYSFVTPANFLANGHSVRSSYKEISEALVIAFKNLGIDLSFPQDKKIFPENGYCMAVSTGSDLSYDGKKLIGSAQFRKQGYILQHGSILIELDRKIIADIFNDDSAAGEVITLGEINKNLCNMDLLAEAVKKGFEEKFEFNFDVCYSILLLK